MKNAKPLKSILFLFSFLVASYSYAEYTRSCEYEPYIDTNTSKYITVGQLYFGSAKKNDAYASVEVAGKGNPDGTSTNRERRKAIKIHAGRAAKECLDDWMYENFMQIKNGKKDGKAKIPTSCKTVAIPSRGPFVGDIRRIGLTDESKESLHSYEVIYGRIAQLCKNFADGRAYFDFTVHIDRVTRDGECPKYPISYFTIEYRVHCDNDIPTKIDLRDKLNFDPY